jgi:hypothetical protein
MQTSAWHARRTRFQHPWKTPIAQGTDGGKMNRNSLRSHEGHDPDGTKDESYRVADTSSPKLSSLSLAPPGECGLRTERMLQRHTITDRTYITTTLWLSGFSRACAACAALSACEILGTIWGARCGRPFPRLRTNCTALPNSLVVRGMQMLSLQYGDEKLGVGDASP